MTKKPFVDLDEEEMKRRTQALGDISLYIPDDTMPSKSSPPDPPRLKDEKPITSVPDHPKKPAKPVVKDQAPPPDDYDTLFLVPNPGSSRCQTYIDRKHYDLIKRYLSAIAPGVSIAGYINNILEHHIEQYWTQIEERYNRESVKPLKK